MKQKAMSKWMFKKFQGFLFEETNKIDKLLARLK